MVLKHTATLHVRHDECDPYGHVNNANYLRYMQEAAFQASAAVGYPLARYEAEGRLWLAHETDIEYLQPLRYGDTVDIMTWVADWRRVRSRRAYEFRHQVSREVVARAQTDWVLLDAVTRRPTSIPPEMVEAYSGAQTVDAPSFDDPRSVVTVPPPPDGVFRQQRRVEWRDLDTAQHVNNAVYVNYLEECALLAAEAHGWPLARPHREGFALIARRHHLEYRQPAHLGDWLEVASWLSDARPASVVRHYTIRRDATLLAQAQTLWVCVDLETGRPRRMPAAMAADFAPNIAT